jgi:hypothetical protein
VLPRSCRGWQARVMGGWLGLDTAQVGPATSRLMIRRMITVAF